MRLRCCGCSPIEDRTGRWRNGFCRVSSGGSALPGLVGLSARFPTLDAPIGWAAPHIGVLSVRLVMPPEATSLDPPTPSPLPPSKIKPANPTTNLEGPRRSLVRARTVTTADGAGSNQWQPRPAPEDRVRRARRPDRTP